MSSLSQRSSAEESRKPLISDRDGLTPEILEKARPDETILYLAFGSNLATSKFEGARRVKPLGYVNAHAPEFELTFDLPGIPYTEPCFANSRIRQTSKNGGNASVSGGSGYLNEKQQHLKPMENLGWSKGLVGTVFEVTAADYKHIIETEGAGAGYQDVVVKCWPIAKDTSTVPEPGSYPEPPSSIPSRLPDMSDPESLRKPFFAHTLLCPPAPSSSNLHRKNNWAQPSHRYLDLIRTGARERGLPAEYVAWVDELIAYDITTTSQRIAKTTFSTLWMPLFGLIFGLSSVITDKRGRAPAWYIRILNGTFETSWWTYDHLFRPWAGDGERTKGT